MLIKNLYYHLYRLALNFFVKGAIKYLYFFIIILNLRSVVGFIMQMFQLQQQQQKDFTDSWRHLDPDWQLPLLQEVGTSVVQQPDEGVSSQTHMRLVARRQLLCIGVAADRLQEK